MVANRDRLKRLIKGQNILEEFDRQAVGHQGGPLRFQEQQLRRGMVRKEGRQGTERGRGMGLARTMLQPRTVDREHARAALGGRGALFQRRE